MTKGWSDYELEGRSKQEPKRHKMQDTVDEMCRVMRETPDKFETTTYRVDFDNGVCLWRSDFRDIWNGNTTERVFTTEQSRQLRAAYTEAMEFKKSRTQETIAKKFKPKKKATKIQHVEQSKTDSLRSQTERDRGIGVVVLGETQKKEKKWWEFWK
ncbi:hypothetical protein [Vibrio phage VH7D]|uniref:Uncharacterized protein n=1 Tax=Vibrio phage VH7D TaxID=1262539 RepID=V9LZF6_9CAUD|nr:hypothetical protein CF80_gp144 [Vibrio phage VH7D]AGB06931.1 hypothetical protein [Vibrio phage VH7D]QBX06215.1 hypothetical protein Va3_262 [Vibrio phage Va3]QNJ54840.1 hypothetical protein vBValMR10Z_300 [Vibrio phage vB_ValM_R10Z]QNJ55227.1 hypothetical protein vBValMR11Z_301 [Vibrio phage vB_ValM_R11Z]